MPLTQPPSAPLLVEIFRRQLPLDLSQAVTISLGALARSLSVPLDRLFPLVQAGYLTRKDSSPTLDSYSMVIVPSPAALTWLTNFFTPAIARPLWDIATVADILGCGQRDVLPLAAAHDIAFVRDEALGILFSTFAVRTLLLRSLKSREHASRWDRQALLWRLLEKDPEKAVRPPVFREEWEEELARVARLEEPARGIRATEVHAAMQDAKKLVGAIAARARAAQEAEEAEEAV